MTEAKNKGNIVNMKQIVKEIVINSVALYLISLFILGLRIEGGLKNYLICGLLLLLGDYVLKPIINLISIPFNVLTLGFFSSITNALILYFITIIFPKIIINGFYFQAISYKTISIPSFYVTRILSYLVISFIIQVIKQMIYWLIEKK